MRSRWLLATVHPETALAGRSRLPSTITVGTARLRTSRAMHGGRWVTLAKGLDRPSPCLCLGEFLVISLTLCDHGTALRSGILTIAVCVVLCHLGLASLIMDDRLFCTCLFRLDTTFRHRKTNVPDPGLEKKEKTKSLPTLIPGQPATATKSLTYPLAARLGF